MRRFVKGVTEEKSKKSKSKKATYKQFDKDLASYKIKSIDGGIIQPTLDKNFLGLRIRVFPAM